MNLDEREAAMRQRLSDLVAREAGLENELAGTRREKERTIGALQLIADMRREVHPDGTKADATAAPEE